MVTRIVGWFLFTTSTAISIIKFALWAIGTSTVLDDAVLLPEKGRMMVAFIAGQPALGFYGFFVLIAVLGLWLALRRAAPHYNRTALGPGQGGGVTSYNQSGGVTAHTVNGFKNEVGK